MERDFKQGLHCFVQVLRTTNIIHTLTKFFSNVDAIKVELNIMNSLIAAKI